MVLRSKEPPVVAKKPAGILRTHPRPHPGFKPRQARARHLAASHTSVLRPILASQMVGAQGPAALAHGTQQQLLAAEDRWSGRHHAFSFASPVPSSSLAALQRPAQEGTPHGAAASGGGSCGAPPPQRAMQARSSSTSPTALSLAATLESAAKQRVRAAAGWRLLARLALPPCTYSRVVQFTLLPGCRRVWPRARCTACRPPRARQRRPHTQVPARRMLPARRCPGSLALQTPPMATRESRLATSLCSPRGPHCSSSSISSSNSTWSCSSGRPAAQPRRRAWRLPPAPAASVVGQLRRPTPGRR